MIYKINYTLYDGFLWTNGDLFKKPIKLKGVLLYFYFALISMYDMT